MRTRSNKNSQAPSQTSRSKSHISKTSRSRSRQQLKRPANRKRDEGSREHSEVEDLTEEILSRQNSANADMELEQESQMQMEYFTTLLLHEDHPDYVPKIRDQLMEIGEQKSASQAKKISIGLIRQIIQKKYSKKFSSAQLQHLQLIDDSHAFWSQAVPFMANMILTTQLPSIDILTPITQKSVASTSTRQDSRSQRATKHITLSRKQIYTILSSMFFMILPEQNLNSIDFSYLYSAVDPKRPQTRLQKLKCLVGYFVGAMKKYQSKGSLGWEEIVTYERHFGPSHITESILDKPSKDSLKLPDIQITKLGIQNYKGEAIVDFANMVLGGGVLHNGSVQEEILFITHPELLILLLVCPPMSDDEAVIVHNFLQYTEHEGYSADFKFKSILKQKNDRPHHQASTMIAIDALDFSCFKPGTQYRWPMVMRELHKACIGFGYDQTRDTGRYSQKKKRLVTGKWGCGAFAGDLQLKFLIQWVAASVSQQHKMVFVNWGEDRKDEQFKQIVSRLKNLCPSRIVTIMKQYCDDLIEGRITGVSLFKHILSLKTDTQS